MTTLAIDVRESLRRLRSPHGTLSRWDYAYIPPRVAPGYRQFRMHTWWAPNGGRVRLMVHIGTGRTEVFVISATGESAKLKAHDRSLSLIQIMRVAAVMGLISPRDAGLVFKPLPF